MLETVKIKTDLCVVGGGLAGICCAISAARNNMKVVLMHERPVYGGNASSEIRMWVCGAHGKNNKETGIIEEIALENYYRNPTKNFHIWDSILYSLVEREKNITPLMNCSCMDASVSKGDFGDGRNIKINTITGYQLTTEKFFCIEAKYFADCSGDSILAPLTDAEFKIGREDKSQFNEPTHVEKADKLTMGMSCLLQGRETDRKIKFTPPDFARKMTDSDFEHRKINIYKTMENYWYLELGGNRDSIGDTEEIKKELLALAFGTWDYIKNSGNFKSENWELEFLGFLPGKRESRRMTGEYIINVNDLIDHTEFSDTVAYGGWPIDDHYPAGFFHKGTPNTNISVERPYCIPYRCLYSKNVSNLYFAGRNISMTHMAMSSIRVMATCALLGQAIGTAAAVANKYNLTPNEVYKEKMEEVQDILMDNDCMLPNKRRKYSELCKQTKIINGSEYLKNGIDREKDGYKIGAKVKNGTHVEYRFEGYKSISKIHITFNSDLNRETLPGDYCERNHMTRCNILKDSPQFYVPKTLCKDFLLEIDTESGTKQLLSVKDNIQRFYDIKTDEKISCIRLIPISNWGESDITEILSFDFI